MHNTRLRGWQRIILTSNTTTVTTAAHWDWKRRALTVPLEAFVINPTWRAYGYFLYGLSIRSIFAS
ncbi:hypothetical protein D6V20_17880 [Vibrio cholerae]|nr:hypothetical protein [Vibrio cholerae]MVC80296.1 hypothetical protein [Vibrio cholerae]